MNDLSRCVGRRYQQYQNWITTPEGGATRRLFLETSKQIALSWVIQKVAISIFALNGGVVVVCTLTGIGLGVALLTHVPALSRVSSRVCGFVARFGLIHLVHEIGVTTFIHEMGHALAGAALFRGKRPNIQIELLGGGSTRTYSATLSRFGQMIGKERAKIALAAAGPMASVVFAMGMIGWASYQTDEAAAERMRIHGAVQLGSDLVYAWGAIGLRNATTQNDFIALQRLGGIHPAVSLSVMVLLPTIQLLWIYRARIADQFRSINYPFGFRSLPIT